MIAVRSKYGSHSMSKSELDNALHFVKSVGGLAKAKLLLAELEAIFVGRV